MGFCKSDQKSMAVVGLLTHNDFDVLRAKTGLYRRVTPRTIILPTAGNTEKGVKQGKSSYLLLSMKKDQANKTSVERVYRQQPLAWEPGLNGSSIDLQLVQEWVQCSCISCTSMLQS